MNIINIGIADDHRLFRKGLIALLSLYDDLNIIWEACDGKDLLQKADEQLPDILLVDVNMPKISGIEATKKLIQKYPKLKIIALSMFEDNGHIIAMIESGAKGYLIKDSEPSDIYISIIELYNKGFINSSLVANALQNKMEASGAESAMFASLNDKDKQYLKLIAEGQSAKEIAASFNTSSRTVEGYIEKIMTKLNAKNRIQLATYAVKHGLTEA
ncbi:MAG: response regulator transcription factor [bacterium]|nr:response regulator transcription factor [bacterium]